MTGEELILFALAMAAIGVICLVAGGLGRLIDWLDRRRSPAPLTREQRAARGMEPPWPWHDASWDDVYDREPQP